MVAVLTRVDAGVGVGWGVPLVENEKKLKLFKFLQLRCTETQNYHFVFFEDLDPIFKFSGSDQTDLKDCSPHVFSIMFDF